MKAGKLARAVVHELRQAGVTDFCVAAGARNAELLIALAETAPPVRTFRFFDERSAGFFAIGRIQATGKPVAVVTTSGTAVAELLPAVVEAHYQGLPLGVVSADRPSRFAGSGAPQVIGQPEIFGSYVRAEGDVADARSVAGFSAAIPAGAPWHLNVRFEEPGAPETGQGDGGSYGSCGGDPEPTPGDFRLSHPVVLVGDLLQSEREETAQFVATLGFPVWAEAQSGLRERCTTLRGGESDLHDGNFRSVIRLGGVPSCRFWRDLENRPEISVISVSRTGYSGLARPSAVVRRLSDLPEFAPATPGAAPTPPQSVAEGEPSSVRWISTLPARGAAVFLGNSLPIREWNSFATWENRGLRPFANRGANGIDGLLSTFFGATADEPEAWAVVGDLSALYDLSAPWITAQLPLAKRRIVVINNGGGKIFDTLPALRDAPGSAREMMANPHATSFRHFAEMWGWGYLRVTGTALDAELPDLVVIEVVVAE